MATVVLLDTHSLRNSACKTGIMMAKCAMKNGLVCGKLEFMIENPEIVWQMGENIAFR